MELTVITHDTDTLLEWNNGLDFTHSQNEIQPERTESKQGKLKEVSDEKPWEKRGKQAVEKGEVVSERRQSTTEQLVACR